MCAVAGSCHKDSPCSIGIRGFLSNYVCVCLVYGPDHDAALPFGVAERQDGPPPVVGCPHRYHATSVVKQLKTVCPGRRRQFNGHCLPVAESMTSYSAEEAEDQSTKPNRCRFHIQHLPVLLIRDYLDTEGVIRRRNCCNQGYYTQNLTSPILVALRAIRKLRAIDVWGYNDLARKGALLTNGKRPLSISG